MMLPIFLKTYNAYLLSPDECVLLSWFCMKQKANGYTPFYCGRERIEQETRIKRRAQEAIIKKLRDTGILRYFEKNVSVGRVRMYEIDFGVLEKSISLIVDMNHVDAGEIKASFREEAAAQKKAQKTIQKTKVKKQDKSTRHNGLVALGWLNEVYKDRCRHYNAQPDRLCNKDYTEFGYTARNIERLALLSARHDSHTIKKAFVVFSDLILKGEMDKIKKPLSFLLNYDEQSDSFPFFENLLDCYKKSYYTPITKG